MRHVLGAFFRWIFRRTRKLPAELFDDDRCRFDQWGMSIAERNLRDRTEEVWRREQERQRREHIR